MMLLPFVSWIIHCVRSETVHRQSSGLMQFIGASFVEIHICSTSVLELAFSELLILAVLESIAAYLLFFN